MLEKNELTKKLKKELLDADRVYPSVLAKKKEIELNVSEEHKGLNSKERKEVVNYMNNFLKKRKGKIVSKFEERRDKEFEVQKEKIRRNELRNARKK